MVYLPLLKKQMKKRKVNKNRILLLICSLVFIILFIISIIKIGIYIKDNRNNKKIEKTISNAITIVPDKELNEIYKVNFDELKKINDDTVAYIKVNNTNIDYIVVKGSDNSYYLDHNFNKNKNVSGWIFADYRNKFDGNDKNIIVYGHNTWDGSMFGSLRKVFDNDWHSDKENYIIKFITEEEIADYQVFSTYVIDKEDYYITTDFNSDSEFETFIKTLKFRSFYQYDVDTNKEDKILTLSTCSGDGKQRIVLHAKKI